MRLLQYKDLNFRRVKAAFDKVKAAIEAGDFRSADVKKLNTGPYYRAKLDYANRLLLQFARIDREAAEARLATLLAEAVSPPARPRRATRPSRSAVRRRLEAKTRRGQTKALRRRPED